jgi:hypothetical protein
VQLCLQGIGVGVAPIDDVPDGTGVTTLRHEHLGGIVLDLVLAVDHGTANRVPGQSDDAVDERELASGVAGWAHKEMLVPAAPVPKIQEMVVHIWIGGILELDRERLSNIVGKSYVGDYAGRCHCTEDAQDDEGHYNNEMLV